MVERIAYQYPESGFTVARLLPERGASGSTTHVPALKQAAQF